MLSTSTLGGGMRLGTALHRAKLDESYDAIVIGSGIGGLATAAILAKKGQKVLVLEKHYTAGGFTHTYSRKGYEWDVGVHYIGSVHKKTSVLRRIFDFVSDGQLQWESMGPVYDRIHIGDEAFDFVAGARPFRDKMVAYFPDEADAIDAYIKLVHKANQSASLYYLERTLSPWLARHLQKYLTRSFQSFSSRTTEEVLRELTSNTRLISVLTGQWGDYGLPPAASSFAMHALVARHYLSGASYPVGGSSSIARFILPVIERAGGQVVTGAEVTEILVEDNQALGIRLKDGRKILGRKIVSAAGVIQTYSHLLPAETIQKHGLDQRLSTIKPSMAHVGAYIGLKATAEELGLEKTNLWIYPDEHHNENMKAFQAGENHDFPVIYISFPSAKDPLWSKTHPGKSTIEIVAPAPYDWFRAWENTEWQKRGKDYDALKDTITEKLLHALYQKLPQLKGRIDFVELSTPLSTSYFSNYSRGEIYGIDHNPARFDENWLRAQTPIRNLYLTGQDIVTCGVGGALCAGVLTSISMLGPVRGISLIRMLLPA